MEKLYKEGIMPVITIALDQTSEGKKKQLVEKSDERSISNYGISRRVLFCLHTGISNGKYRCRRQTPKGDQKPITLCSVILGRDHEFQLWTDHNQKKEN